ncbi:MAG: hypothetical protein QM626_04975 [Microbacterium sp.]|uniref:hypothetical protein n=1 Tax=Microbacterium sp. TaxID=51671 RepID=UPI0039E6A0FD
MARTGGRNSFMAWLGGIACLGVIGALLYLAVPGIPGAIAMVGDTLRAAHPATMVSAPAATTADTAASGCRALYSDALWAELTQMAGGDPVESMAAPATGSTALAAALSPAVRVTCTFTAGYDGRIVTTVSDVAADAASAARTALVADGFSCASTSGGGVDCTRTDDDVVEQDVVRGGVWVTTTFTGWQPTGYAAGMAAQLW